LGRKEGSKEGWDRRKEVRKVGTEGRKEGWDGKKEVRKEGWDRRK
jgi:hypothetical protein